MLLKVEYIKIILREFAFHLGGGSWEAVAPSSFWGSKSSERTGSIQPRMWKSEWLDSSIVGVSSGSVGKKKTTNTSLSKSVALLQVFSFAHCLFPKCDSPLIYIVNFEDYFWLEIWIDCYDYFPKAFGIQN